MGVVVLLVIAGFSVWWLTGNKKWGLGGKLLFWAAVVFAAWILVASASHHQS